MPRLAPDDPRLSTPDFPHGEDRGYRRGCSCAACRLANSFANKRTQPVPADAARAHVKMLRSKTDASTAVIAHVAGLAERTIRGALAQDRIYRTSETAILDVTVEAVEEYLATHRRLHDPEPVRRHIAWLMTFEDCTLPAIAAASGVAFCNIDRLMVGKTKSVTTETLRAVKRLTPQIVRRNAALVTNYRAVTRLRALQANQWSLEELGERMGYTGQSGIPIMKAGRRAGRITQDMDRRVEALYDEIGDQVGPSPRAAVLARAAGYYPPIHYDDDMLLIRDSIPDKHWIPGSSPDDKARTWLRMVGLTLREYSGKQIAAKMGTSSKTVERARSEVGIQLEHNAHTSPLLAYVKPGQEALVDLIRQHVEDIDLNEAVPVLDSPGLDYVALWNSLVAGAAKLRAVPGRVRAAA